MNDTHKKPKEVGKSSFELNNPGMLTNMLPVEPEYVFNIICLEK